MDPLLLKILGDATPTSQPQLDLSFSCSQRLLILIATRSGIMGANITSHPPMDDSSAQALEKDGTDVVCLEQSATMSKDAKVEASAKSLDLSVKEQYQKLWTSMKSQRRFCWWALYVMVLTFAWGKYANLVNPRFSFGPFQKLTSDQCRI